MNPEITAAVVGAIAGGAVSLGMNELLPRLRTSSISDQLSFKTEPLFGCRITARVINDSVFEIRDAWAYITIDHELNDVTYPPHRQINVTVHPKNQKKIIEDRLCWSRLGHPASVDIYPGEQQLLDICEFSPNSDWIQFPSETGYGTSPAETSGRFPGVSRVFLRWGKRYPAKISIVSKDTKRRDFRILIDPNNRKCDLVY